MVLAQSGERGWEKFADIVTVTAAWAVSYLNSCTHKDLEECHYDQNSTESALPVATTIQLYANYMPYWSKKGHMYPGYHDTMCRQCYGNEIHTIMYNISINMNINIYHR